MSIKKPAVSNISTILLVSVNFPTQTTFTAIFGCWLKPQSRYRLTILRLLWTKDFTSSRPPRDLLATSSRPPRDLLATSSRTLLGLLSDSSRTLLANFLRNPRDHQFSRSGRSRNLTIAVSSPEPAALKPGRVKRMTLKLIFVAS